MTQARGRSPLAPFAWLLVGLVAGLALAAGAAQLARQYVWFGYDRLAVVRVAPGPDEAIGATGSIVLTFSEPLDPASLGGRLRLDGGRLFKLEVDGPAVAIAPASPLLPGPHRLTVAAGVESTTGVPLEQTQTLAFSVRLPGLLFLRGEPGRTRLYLLDPSGDAIVMSGDDNVIDYAPEPAGGGVLYAASNAEGGADLWWVDRAGQVRTLWVDCGPDTCSQPAWSPAGDRFAYSRRERDPSGQLGPGRIWTAGRAGSQPAPLYQDAARSGLQPSWSPDGRYLSFDDPGAEAVVLLDLDTVQEQVLPSGAGVGGSWSPDGREMLFLVLDLSQRSPRHLLYRVLPAARTTALVLSPADGWRDVGLPAWSASGRWLALSAQHDGGQARQLWRISSDGTQALAIADDPAFSYGGPHWSPAGGQLVFQRFPVGVVDPAPDLLLWSAAGGPAEVKVEDAGSADWLP